MKATTKKGAGKNKAGKNSTGKNSTGKNSTGKNSTGKNNAGKNNAGKNDTGKNSTGQNETGTTDSFTDQAGTSNSGASHSRSGSAGTTNTATIRSATSKTETDNCEPSNQGVAIVGMSCLYPGAPDLRTFWSNIVRGVDATREVSDKEWDIASYYDPDGRSKGLSYSKRGGFISEYADFDPLKFGIMPSAVVGSDADQFLTLKLAAAAMADAGYDLAHTDKNFDRDRAEIILGRISAPGAGSMNLIQQSKTVHEIAAILAEVLPDQSDETIEAIVKQVQGRLAACTADNMPGAMPNVLAGRIAAKLGFRGRNLLIDAACASSMVAVETAVNDLLDKRCDFALAGGVHINASAVFFQMFCILGALSHKDNIRPFDQDADGTLLGEGVGILCLKRYEDAIASGDRIYATIRGIASSSDGYGSSVLAPSIEGEALAMRKAYEIAGISPSTVQLLEAHGTGTPVGDVVELEAVAKVFKNPGDATEPWCAIGSIKSMIGHCQSASAVAGIIKATLALHHKILPPTLHVTKPNTKIDWANHPCYVNTQARPWIKPKDSAVPRRAAVSAFGFGGINGHMILEEFISSESQHVQNPKPNPQTTNATATANTIATANAIANANRTTPATGNTIATANTTATANTITPAAQAQTNEFEQESVLHVFDTEVFTFFSASKDKLLEELAGLVKYIEHHPDQSLKDLAYSVNCILNRDPGAGDAKKKGYRLSLVASSLADLAGKLRQCLEVVAGTSLTIDKDVYFTAPGGVIGGKLAFLYPGLGSAYTNMLADLCMHFPEVREVFEIVDNVALSAGATSAPSKTIFPAPFDKGLRAVPTLLASADFAVVAVLLAEYAIYQLLMHLGINPDVIMGCSTGEFAAITTTGSVDVLSVAKTFYQLSTKVARSIPEESLANLRTLRVLSSWAKVSKMAGADIYLSADLGDDHVIVTGSTDTIAALSEKLKEARVACHLLPVPIPYHTPLVASIIDANNEAIRAVDIQPLSTPGWSCSTAEMYPQNVEAMRASFVELFTKPIALRQTVQAMYEDGVRIFVEVGPNGILTSSLAGILADKPHVGVPSNLASRSGLSQIHHLLAILHTQAVPANLAFLYKRRDPQSVDFNAHAGKELSSAIKQLSLTHAALKLDVNALPKITRFKQDNDAGAAELGDGSRAFDGAVGRAGNKAGGEAGDEAGDKAECEAGKEADAQYSDEQDFAPSEESVLQTFLNTNASFYSRLNAMTEKVMQSYIEGTQELPDVEEIHADHPFLNRAQISRHGDSTQMYLTLDLAHDLYLLDHAIGGLVSTMHQAKVHLVPLMVTLEIMASAALAHVQDGVPVRVEQVKAFRRIVVDRQGLTLRALATGSAARVNVELSDATDPSLLFATAEFVFADDYLDASPIEPRLNVVDPTAPARLVDRKNLYGSTPLSMFHGPLMQSVLALEQVGNRAVSGTASARPASGWMPDLQEANFLLHPLLLDNASQFVLFYLYEKNLPATALLPFLIESVELFAFPQDLGQAVSVTAVLPTLTERATEANLEVMSDDQMVLKINGINSRRVILSPLWEQFVENPVASFLSTQVALNDHLVDRGVIMLAEQSILPDDEVILDWCLDYILTRAEQAVWRDTTKTKKRKIDWLLGRIAAKEAVRKLVLNLAGRSLGPHDVEIISDKNGAPLVRIADSELPEILVSISHTQGVAVALAALSGLSKPGIDAEMIRQREPSFAMTFLKAHELDYLASCPKDRVNAELTRFWSAKEALYKASGGAIEMSSFSLATDVPGQDVMVMTGGQPEQSTKAYVSARSDLVIAYVI
jgi:acyl transferase domain-containing protein/phosphopantetheinyl transferase (holo-ACP synthase)